MSSIAGDPRSPRAVRNSPLLILFGRGPAAEDLAGELAGHCTAAGLVCRTRAIDDCQDVVFDRFPGLVVVLPELLDGTSVRAVLEPCAELVTDYRARWPHGLAQLGAPQVDPLDVGVVQLVGHRVLAHNPTMRSAYNRACAVHLLDRGEPVDILAVYRDADSRLTEREFPWDDPHDIAGEVLERTWGYLRSWGIVTRQAVPALLMCLEGCRANYEKPALSELYRPSPDWRATGSTSSSTAPTSPSGPRSSRPGTRTAPGSGARSSPSSGVSTPACIDRASPTPPAPRRTSDACTRA